MTTKRIYGDENLGYKVLVKNMSSQEAKDYLTINSNDGLLERMNQDRLMALRIRAGETD